MRGLRGKRVLISGGSSGLAAAARFLEEGSRAFLCGADADEVEAAAGRLVPGGGVPGLACDVSAEAAGPGGSQTWPLPTPSSPPTTQRSSPAARWSSTAA